MRILHNISNSLPHAEERPRARLEARAVSLQHLVSDPCRFLHTLEGRGPRVRGTSGQWLVRHCRCLKFPSGGGVGPGLRACEEIPKPLSFRGAGAAREPGTHAHRTANILEMQVFLGSGLGPSDRPGMTFLGKTIFSHAPAPGRRWAIWQIFISIWILAQPLRFRASGWRRRAGRGGAGARRRGSAGPGSG